MKVLPSKTLNPRWRKWRKLGGTVEANAAARADSWPKIVAFLDQSFATP